MLIEDVRRIRKRIEPTLANFRSVYGCYVAGNWDIVARMEIPVLDMDQEEKEMYAGFLKKVLSGTPERNLIDIEFDPNKIEDSDEHRLLMALKSSQLRDEGMRDLMYQSIIENLDMEGDSYVILLAADTYDLKTKDVKGEEWSEESNEQFEYFLCAVCPVKSSKAALQYIAQEQEFRGISTGSILSSPQVGFMFPVLDAGMSDIYQVQYYSKSTAEIHDELITGLFAVDKAPMAAEVQKTTFNNSLADALGKECSLDVVTALQAKMVAVAEAEKEEKTMPVPEITIEDIDDVLANKGVSNAGIGEFHETLERRFDGAATFNINNLMQKRAFEIKTPETKVVTEPETAIRLRTRTIDGVTYLLVPVGESVQVNGVEIAIEFEEE